MMPVVINMQKARAIHMDSIRAVRDKELAALDIAYLRAIEDGDLDAQAMIAADKQMLRDLPETFNLNKVSTPAELSGLWPDRLGNGG